MGDSNLMTSQGKGAEIGAPALPDLVASAIHCLPNPSGNQARLLEALVHLQVRLATDRFLGISRLETHLTRFLATEKKATLETAVARKASRLIGQIRLETEITVRALRLPISDLERRIATFGETSKGWPRGEAPSAAQSRVDRYSSRSFERWRS